MTASLVRGDAHHLPLVDESVDLIVTSPPYWSLRRYEGDEAGKLGNERSAGAYLEHLWAVTDECHRVLKPTGSMFVNLGDRFAARGSAPDGISSKSTLSGNGHRGGVSRTGESNKIRSTPRPDHQAVFDVPDKGLVGLPWRFALGLSLPSPYRHPMSPSNPKWLLRSEIVWDKPNAMPESVGDRVRRSHEQFFHFTKSSRYFAAIDDIREPHVRDWVGGANGGRDGWDRGDHLNVGLTDANPHPKGRLPVSVWRIASEPLKPPEELAVTHYAAFPSEWPRRLILGWSPPAGTVLDPFGGTGTVAMMADVLGRHGIHVELAEAYQRLARWRISESGHGQRCVAKAEKLRRKVEAS